MRIHICPLDKQCRSYGAPWRVYVFLPRYTYIIALRPEGTTQVWTKQEGFTDRWGWFVRHPSQA